MGFNTIFFTSLIYLSHATHFHYSDCMQNGRNNPDNVIHVNSATVSPNQVTTPGDVNVQVNVNVLKYVAGGLSLELSIHRKVLGLWVPLPCISEVGSCTYPDACKLLAKGFVHHNQTKCPAPFVNENFPCTCPFTPGNYILNDAHFNIPILKGIWSILGPGDYKAEAHLIDKATGNRVGCHNMEITLKNAPSSCSFLGCIFG